MAKSKTLEEILDEADELVRLYKSVPETQIPKSIAEAKKTNWELVVNAIELGFLVHYPRSEQHEDSRRVISLPVALALMEEFEDELISETVRNPKEIFINKIRGLVRVVILAVNSIGIIWDIIKAEWEKASLLDLLLDSLGILERIIEATYEIIRRFGLLIVTYFLTALGTRIFTSSVAGVMKRRDRFSVRIRKKALPQRSGKRVFRRKVSRL